MGNLLRGIRIIRRTYNTTRMDNPNVDEDRVNAEAAEMLEQRFDEAISNNDLPEARRVRDVAKESGFDILVQTFESKLEEERWKLEEQNV